MRVKIVAAPFFADAPHGVDLATVGFSRTTRRLLASVAYPPGDMAV